MSTPALRLATAADGAALAAIYAPSVTAAAISFEEVAPSDEEMAARVAATLPRAPWLVCAIAGDVAGFAYGSRHRERAAYRWSVDVSVYVAAGWQRRGVARALYTSLLALLRVQGFYTAHAGIVLPNAGSVRLHESLGFEPVGVYPAVGYKRGAWHDVGWWRLALRPRDAHPAEPRTPAEAQGDAWDHALAAGLPCLS